MQMQPGQMPMPSEAPSANPGEAQEAKEAKSDTAQQMVVDINDGLSALLAKVPEGQDKDALQGIVQTFQEWVDSMGAPKAAPKGGAVPVEAGAANAKPAM